MIQFNLLPDVKVEYVKAQRTKRLVIGSAIIATVSAFALFLVLLLAVQGVQRKSMSDLEKDIAKYSKELKQTPDLNKILTIQSQLGTLNGLHDQKVMSSRIFGVLQQTTPSEVTISNHVVDYTASTMTIEGQAPSLDRINTFVDSLKFATFEQDDSDSKAFSDVVLSQFGRSETGSTYSITLTYDPLIFNGTETVKLVVPKTISTRSVLGQPTDIFQKQPDTNGQEN